jgi:hypothetical protein
VYPYIKRWIASAETFDRWWFAWDEIVEIDPSDSQQMEKFEKLERGPDIE